MDNEKLEWPEIDPTLLDKPKQEKPKPSEIAVERLGYEPFDLTERS